MLVLSRKRLERIQVRDVIFTILAVEGKRVKIGIEAPETADIIRLPKSVEVEVRRDGELSK